VQATHHAPAANALAGDGRCTQGVRPVTRIVQRLRIALRPGRAKCWETATL
jgi:hypothetical protein